MYSTSLNIQVLSYPSAVTGSRDKANEGQLFFREAFNELNSLPTIHFMRRFMNLKCFCGLQFKFLYKV